MPDQRGLLRPRDRRATAGVRTNRYAYMRVPERRAGDVRPRARPRRDEEPPGQDQVRRRAGGAPQRCSSGCRPAPASACRIAPRLKLKLAYDAGRPRRRQALHRLPGRRSRIGGRDKGSTVRRRLLDPRRGRRATRSARCALRIPQARPEGRPGHARSRRRSRSSTAGCCRSRATSLGPAERAQPAQLGDRDAAGVADRLLVGARELGERPVGDRVGVDRRPPRRPPASSRSSSAFEARTAPSRADCWIRAHSFISSPSAVTSSRPPVTTWPM